MKINQVTVETMNGIFKEEFGRLINVRQYNNFETKAMEGFNYEVLAEKNNFEKISIKVESSVPVITAEQLAESTSPVYISFVGIQGRFYFSDRTRNYEFSCRAKEARIVSKTGAAGTPKS